jgi:hypothetical protein
MSMRELLEARLDGESDANILRGIAIVLEQEAVEAERQGTGLVASLYRAYCARLHSMIEAMEPTVL